MIAKLTGSRLPICPTQLYVHLIPKRFIPIFENVSYMARRVLDFSIKWQFESSFSDRSISRFSPCL